MREIIFGPEVEWTTFSGTATRLSVFNHALVQVPESIAYIACITHVTLKFINYTLLVNNKRSNLMHFSSRWILSETKAG